MHSLALPIRARRQMLVVFWDLERVEGMDLGIKQRCIFIGNPTTVRSLYYNLFQLFLMQLSAY